MRGLILGLAAAALPFVLVGSDSGAREGWESSGAGARPAAAFHTVRAHETVWRIARAHGVSVDAIVEANRIDDVTRVHVGRRLLIPGPRPAARVPSRVGSPEVRPEPVGRSPTLRQLVVQVEQEVRAARFEEALASAATAREMLAPLGASPPAGALRTRLAVAEATAQVALGRQDAAVASFAGALRADPHLELDPSTTSPKVLRVFHRTRAGAER